MARSLWYRLISFDSLYLSIYFFASFFCLFGIYSIYTFCDNIPIASLYSLNLLNHSWPSHRQVVSLISGQGYFTLLNKPTKHNIYNWEGGRKEEQTNTDLGWLQAQEGRSLWHFLSILCFCRLSRVCIRAKFPQSQQERWLILSRWPTGL